MQLSIRNPSFLARYETNRSTSADVGLKLTFLGLAQIPALDGVVDILSWWSFTDDFQQDSGSLPTKEYSDIYGLMTYHGVPKPGWRGFELMAAAGDHRVNATLGSDTVKVQQQVEGGNKCVEEDGTNMAGFTLSTVKAPTKAHCCSKCQAVDQQHCSFWTFHDGECVFKSSDAGRTKAVAYDSGSRVVPGNSTAVGSPLSVFATVNTSTATVDTLQVFLSLWGNPSLPGVVKPRTVKVTVTHAADVTTQAIPPSPLPPTSTTSSEITHLRDCLGFQESSAPKSVAA